MVKIIACIDLNGNIGKDNDLLFHLKADMDFFRKTTTNNIIIMGKNTYKSLGCKPLPKRLNIVLTDEQFEHHQNLVQTYGLDVTLPELIDNLQEKKYKQDIYIIGGANVYNQALEIGLADELLLTKVYEEVDGDVNIDMDLVREKYEQIECLGMIFEDEYIASIERWVKKEE